MVGLRGFEHETNGDITRRKSHKSPFLNQNLIPQPIIPNFVLVPKIINLQKNNKNIRGKK
jgi:hypothetical protein